MKFYSVTSSHPKIEEILKYPKSVIVMGDFKDYDPETDVKQTVLAVLDEIEAARLSGHDPKNNSGNVFDASIDITNQAYKMFTKAAEIRARYEEGK